MSRQRRREGEVVAVPLGDGYCGYGRLLIEPLVEFYDFRASRQDSPALDAVVSSPVAFAVDVMNSAVTSGRWTIVGRKPMTSEERATPVYFSKQDPLTGELSIYWEDPESGEVHERSATYGECANLETAAVWSAEHVEDRLRDHFAGRPNKWTESLRPAE